MLKGVTGLYVFSARNGKIIYKLNLSGDHEILITNIGIECFISTPKSILL